jgi:predicted ABC-type ATPase
VRHGFLVTGPNCSGKTTSVQKALHLMEIAPDNPYIEVIQADNDDRFKGSAEEQGAALLRIWSSDVSLVLIEGTRINTPTVQMVRANPGFRIFRVFMTRQSPDVMKAHMQARCEKRGKTFRADYWSRQKLEYEGSRRYPNIFRKNGFSPKIYDIDLEYNVCEKLVEDLQLAIEEAVR